MSVIYICIICIIILTWLLRAVLIYIIHSEPNFLASYPEREKFIGDMGIFKAVSPEAINNLVDIFHTSIKKYVYYFTTLKIIPLNFSLSNFFIITTTLFLCSLACGVVTTGTGGKKMITMRSWYVVCIYYIYIYYLYYIYIYIYINTCLSLTFLYPLPGSLIMSLTPLIMPLSHPPYNVLSVTL